MRFPFTDIQNTAHTNVRFLVRASYLQIYNEVISDLLKPERSNLSIREDKKRGVFVEGLSEWVVRSPKEVYGLIKRGTSLRATGSTRINETSSRSHALFIIIVEQNEMIYEEDAAAPNHTQPGMDEQEKVRAVAGANTLVRQSFKVGKLNLVDLAGSERVRISGAKGRRLEEVSLSGMNYVEVIADERELTQATLLSPVQTHQFKSFRTRKRHLVSQDNNNKSRNRHQYCETHPPLFVILLAGL